MEDIDDMEKMKKLGMDYLDNKGILFLMNPSHT